MRWAALLFVTGCLHDNLVPCGEITCPANGVCVVDRCATSAQVEACVGLDNGAACNVGVNGHCGGGICESSICGDGQIEFGEVCDDGNQAPSDGCSADCRSNETCGNGIPDFASGEECDRGTAGVSGDGCSSACTIEVPVWREETRTNLDVSQYSGGATYDRARARIVMLTSHVQGGATVNETWEWNGRWIFREPENSPPVLVDSGQNWRLVYDVARARTVAFANATTSSPSLTFAWDGVTWTDMHPVTTPTPLNVALAYDDAREETVLVGDGQTWSWNGVDWALKAVLSPPGVTTDISIGYDRDHQQIVGLFGTNATVTWLWNGTRWSTAAGTVPPMGGGMPMVFDAVTNRLVGYGNDLFIETNDDDVWNWDGSRWRMTTPSPTLITRRHLLAFDDATGELVVIGGYHFAFGDQGEDWRLTGTTWTRRRTLDQVAPQALIVSAYDEARGALVVFAATSPVTASTWDGKALVRITDVADFAVPGRFSACYSPARQSTFVVNYDTVSELAGSTLSALPQAPVIAGAVYSAMVCDRVTGWPRIFYLGTTIVFDGTTWTKVPNTAAVGSNAQVTVTTYDPIRRAFALYTVDRNGGAQFWESPDAIAWTMLTAPPVRRGAALLFNPLRSTVMLYGGDDHQTASTDLFEWDGIAWRELAIPGARPPPSGGGVPANANFDQIHGRVVTFAEGSSWTFGFDGITRETCFAATDEDHDGLQGCADPDCWGRCTPGCPPGTTCDPAQPSCGDGVCAALEDYTRCPSDCPP